MSEAKASHPIGVVARQTGLGQDVIRAWERRYEAISPLRSEGNQRLYTSEDIGRLRLLKRATEAGWQIGRIATLADEEILQLLDEARADSSSQTAGPGRDVVSSHVDSAVDAVERLDEQGLRRLLDEASVQMSRTRLLDGLLVPLMEEVGRACWTGRMRTANEHLASSVVRSFLDSLHSAFPPSERSPVMVVTTPVHQVHELGALLVSATARIEGWRTTYLGPNLPAEEIAAVAVRLRARAVALSITYPGDDPALLADLRRLGRLLDSRADLLVGGRNASGYQSVLDEIGATRLENIGQLRSYLQASRSSHPVARS